MLKYTQWYMPNVPVPFRATLGSYLFMIQLKLEEEHDIGSDKIPHWEQLNVLEFLPVWRGNKTFYFLCF